MSGLNKLMGRGILPPVVHGVLDYPLAAVLIVLPLVLSFDDDAAKWIAFAFGIGAAALAVGTAWSTGIVRVIPPLLHGYADIIVTVVLFGGRERLASGSAPARARTASALPIDATPSRPTPDQRPRSRQWRFVAAR